MAETEQGIATYEYERARTRALRKRKFRSDVVGYVVVNTILVGIWAATGFGYFWPGWVMAIWAVFLLATAWEVFYRRDLTDDDIRREMEGHR